VNNITTLADVAQCTRLRELYVRKNALADLGEVAHLRGLPCLRVLWLSDNPLAEGPAATAAMYRATVVRTLPQLQKLVNQSKFACLGDCGCAFLCVCMLRLRVCVFACADICACVCVFVDGCACARVCASACLLRSPLPQPRGKRRVGQINHLCDFAAKCLKFATPCTLRRRSDHRGRAGACPGRGASAAVPAGASGYSFRAPRADRACVWVPPPGASPLPGRSCLLP